MKDIELFETFAARFVRKPFRARFVHEAMKKPGKLLARIFHNIDEVFPIDFANGSPTFSGSDGCVLLCNSDQFRRTTWAVAQREFWFGDGALLISYDGTKFYAETEASPGAPTEVYAGGS